MLNAQALQEIDAMVADLANATTRGDLDSLHFNWLSCEPDVSESDEDVRATCADYIKEFRHACACAQA